MDQFNLRHQYLLYLERVGLKESDMGEVQRIETERAFMGACGQILIVLRDDLSSLPEEKAIEKCESTVEQVLSYFEN